MKHDDVDNPDCQATFASSHAALCEVMRRSFEGDPFQSTDDYLSCLKGTLGAGDLLDLHRKMTLKYGMPALGTSRVTYLSRSVVFKVPISPEGWRINDAEASLISTYFVAESELGHTRLFFIEDIPILAMEMIRPASIAEIKDKFGHIPDFVSAIDMAQVGFTKKGFLKAYDYGDLL